MLAASAHAIRYVKGQDVHLLEKFETHLRVVLPDVLIPEFRLRIALCSNTATRIDNRMIMLEYQHQ